MLSNLFQISFLIFLIYISYKSGFLVLFNYIIGCLLVLFFTDLHFQGNYRTKAEIIIFLLNLFLYSILFCSSVFIYFDKENEKRHFFIIPLISYFFIILIETTIFKFEDAFFSVFLPIMLAFFPLYIFKYYIKYLWGK
jgi:hypothetical protein